MFKLIRNKIETLSVQQTHFFGEMEFIGSPINPVAHYAPLVVLDCTVQQIKM
jgi:hypothetical protein